MDTSLNRYAALDARADGNDEELARIYDDWAARYEHDNDNALGTVSQPVAVHYFSRFAQDRSISILDVGCGTGLVGRHLAEAGYTIVDGLDLSVQMLEIARSRPYRRLHCASLSAGLPFDDGAYGAALCVGVFTHGHVPSSALAELARVVRPDGLVCFTVNDDIYHSDGFEAEARRLETAGVWTPLVIENDRYMTAEGVTGWYHVMRVS